MFYADLHIHSKYSRATSRDADLPHLAGWARRKGVSLLGTGDFTHPQWFAELQRDLVPAEPGLFRLVDDLQRGVDEELPAAGAPAVRFMLQVEISTIYKRGSRTRKVHHLIYVPGWEQAERLIQKLAKIGNLTSDGRPILGLDSRDLLELTLDCGDGCFLVPAHIWTPWFAVLGSQSGFDSVAECYGDLAPEIFALETGLSSDPPMNWRLSQLDRFTLVSNSDAHSPPKIGREACVFASDLDYFAIRRALQTGPDYGGTVEFFPEEGKYHLDGHRKCNVRLEPEQTRSLQGRCPACGKPLTIGVMNRVNELADRQCGEPARRPSPFRSLVPLSEIIAEVRGVGEQSRKVQETYAALTSRVGSELFILEHAPLEDIRRAGSPLVAEAIRRMRGGQVIRHAGYDGEYGTIRLFEDGELKSAGAVSLLFSAPAEAAPAAPQAAENAAPYRAVEPRSSEPTTLPHAGASDAVAAGEGPILQQLDADQRSAARTIHGPLLIIAGPGTGKTRTLTHRLAHLVAEHGVAPEQCLTLTFSRRAAREMQERLEQLLPEAGANVPVLTFHALGLRILQEQAARLELPAQFRVADDRERSQLLRERAGLTERQADRLLAEISRIKRNGATPSAEAAAWYASYGPWMRQRSLLDFDDLILLPAQLLQREPDLAAAYRARWPWVSVDEYQDLDENQYGLLRQLVAPDGNLCAIGDPDQSIYGFRGSNPEIFLRFARDFPGARTVQLTRNYRSSPTIVAAALQAIAPTTLVTERTLQAMADNSDRIAFHASPTERAEAEFVVHTIERAIGGSTFFSRDSGRVDATEVTARSFADFAVLYRTAAQADALVEAFARSGIPCQRKSHQRWSEQPTVAALMRFLEQAESAPGTPIGVAERLKQAAAAIGGEHPGAAQDALQLQTLAERYGEDLPQFLSELALGAEADTWDPRADRVSLLTLHAAKGLEFPVVFLVGCEDGLLPLRWGPADGADLAEECRLFFVGLTRARDRLYLTHARQRLWRGQIREMQPSPFLEPIREELLERIQQAEGRKRRKSSGTQLQLF